MHFGSDNTSGVAPEIAAAIMAASTGYAPGYGTDPLMETVRTRIRETFEAPEAAVYLVATGTIANVLSLATFCPPWSMIFCHEGAHIQEDECGAPEFYTGGARLNLIAGADGRITPEALQAAIGSASTNGVHNMQRGMVSLTNVTEAGTVYTPQMVQALTSVAKSFGLPVHMDGARFANAVVATGATPAELTWKAGIDVLSFGGTKNGCMGVEAVVIFDPARAWEFELRRKRGGHLFSKHRYLSVQMATYLQDRLWLDLAGRANRAAARLAKGLAAHNQVSLPTPVEANILFPEWPAETAARLQKAGAEFKSWPLPDGRARARLVTSWSTTDTEVDALLAGVAGEGS